MVADDAPPNPGNASDPSQGLASLDVFRGTLNLFKPVIETLEFLLEFSSDLVLTLLDDSHG